MRATVPPLLVATFGNTMAGDDAFGQLVGDRVSSMELPGVEVANLGAQPYGLVHRLEGGRDGLGAAVVAIQAGLADQDADLSFAHRILGSLYSPNSSRSTWAISPKVQ